MSGLPGCYPTVELLSSCCSEPVVRDSLASSHQLFNHLEQHGRTPMTRLRRKALIPLATALAAGAVAVGSGATFTSTSSSTASFTTGTLSQSNDHSVIFNAGTMKPGDSATGTVTITNTGSLAQQFNLTESGASNPFGSALQLTISDGATQVWAGNFDALPTSGVSLAPTAWAAGASHTYTFKVTLDSSVGNGLQGQTAAATFTWNGTQAS
jgi:hypothetical protein